MCTFKERMRGKPTKSSIDFYKNAYGSLVYASSNLAWNFPKLGTLAKISLSSLYPLLVSFFAVSSNMNWLRRTHALLGIFCSRRGARYHGHLSLPLCLCVFKTFSWSLCPNYRWKSEEALGFETVEKDERTDLWSVTFCCRLFTVPYLSVTFTILRKQRGL